MTCAFQDRENLYLLLDYLDGGDLRYYINRHYNFNEEQISTPSTSYRICHQVHHGRTPLSPWKQHHPSRHQTRKHHPRSEGLLQNHRHGSRQILENGKFTLNQWNTRLHGPWSPSQAKSLLLRRLLRRWSHCLWTSDGQKAIPRQRQKIYPRLNASQRSQNTQHL